MREPIRLPEPPVEFTASILEGGRRIHAWERRKRRARRIGAGIAVCAALAVIVGLAARPVEDTVVSDSPSPSALLDVWAHPEDAYYHASSECEFCHEGAVVLRRETAIEFGKEPCEACMQ